jgi:phosphatidyl-myo-inositol dimannoside synthase
VSKTLVITNDFPPRRGGIENFVFSICQAMPPDEVVVYTARMDGCEETDSSVDYPVIRDRAGMLLPTRRVARNVQAVAREHACDCVIFGAAAPLGLLARGLRQHSGVTHQTAITHGHEVWWAKVPLTRWALRRIGDDVDVMTYVSEFCRRRIEPALSPAARKRMQRLSPTVDKTRFHPGVDGSGWRIRLGIPQDVPVVLSASRLVRRKGQDMLIRSWPSVVDRVASARLVIVGDGPSRRRLGRLARTSGAGESISFVPGVPWEEMPAVYAMADAFAMPCRTRLWGLEPEAFGIVFLEAAAVGLRVITGNSGGAKEAALLVGGSVVNGRSLDHSARAVCNSIASKTERLPSQGREPH